MTTEPFTLTNEPVKPTLWRCPKPEPARQKVLFSGLNLLPDQNDLFATDGQPEVAFQNGVDDIGSH